MYRIIYKKSLAPQIDEMVVEAPEIARHAQPGNFIVLRLHERGERIPLTIAEADPSEGTITLLFQKIGKTTYELGDMQKGDVIMDILGPLGHPTPMSEYGHCVLVGGGIGTATLYPILKGLKAYGNRTTVILGARTEGLIVWEDRFRETADDVLITTDDGSYGRKGLVTDALKEIIDRDRVAVVFAVGPVPMMRAVSMLTRPYKIKTIVSLNPIMVEGSGMCGACRVNIGGETRFTCVDGPEFDGHEVDFDELSRRLRLYSDEEEASLKRYLRKRKRAGYERKRP